MDWLNVLTMLDLEIIDQIPEDKKEKAIKRLTKEYTTEVLLELEPHELEQLVADELSELMKKELEQIKRETERNDNKFKGNVIPLKKGGIIRIDPRDLKDFDGDIEKFMKNIYKRLINDDDNDDDDDNDEGDDNYREDTTGYYI